VILTGANRDGARGLAAIKEHGGTTVVEDPGTAASPEMPEAALARTKPDWILPLPEIALRLRLLSETATARGLVSREVGGTVMPYGN
jgi:two-component system chemotaxis response regulator CheB